MKKSALLLLLVSVLLIFTACNNTEEPDVSYTVKWVDENGNILAEQTVDEGDVPSFSYNAVDTAEWDYTFDGWATTANGSALSSIPVANADATYYALVSATKQRYTVSFNTLGGSTIASQTVEYGDNASLPEVPTYEGYRFVGWSKSSSETVLVDFDAPITGNVEYFAVWNETIDVKGLLSALLDGYNLNPMSYIPASMRFDYGSNLVDSDDIVADYSSFVNVSDITYGFGEQWYMILQNIEQSMTFFNALSVVDLLSTTSITAFNNYFDQNPADTAHYEFESGIYNVTVRFDGQIIFYVVEYTNEFPLIGEVSAQIALAMNSETGEKTARIQLGDANALTYVIRDNSYEFAIKYLNVRTAMFSIGRNDDGTVSGKIYEYLAVSDLEISSVAEFFITDDYVSVVGNKASGLVGFTGTICELYDANNGKMIGYEVNETLSSINFDTLWFNLDSVNGINSIKYVEATQNDDAKLYVNGLSEVWESKNVGGIGLDMLSRRFDIEFRTQYVASYDSASDKYVVHTVQVPMLFVQEGHFDTLTDDISSKNELSAYVTVSADDLAKLLADYDELIPLFNEHKDVFTKDLIIHYIGQKITFA